MIIALVALHSFTFYELTMLYIIHWPTVQIFHIPFSKEKYQKS